MKILLLGSGGREHALAWRLRQDDPGLQLFTAPGNAGTGQLGTNLSLGVTDLNGLVAWALREKPDLTIFGPKAPAARLEGSKVYTKNFLLKHRLPTAPGACFSDSLSAYAYSQKHNVYPQVLKADGLAAGKGVIIAQAPVEAAQTIDRIMDQRIFGEAG